MSTLLSDLWALYFCLSILNLHLYLYSYCLYFYRYLECIELGEWVTNATSGDCSGVEAGIDKSLDLEKFSRRNYSYFSLSSWRIVFSFLFLFLIFKIFRQKISCSSRFVRFSKQFSFSSRFSRLWRKSSLSTLDLWDSVHCFSFSSCEKCYIFEREICIFQGLRCGGKMLWYEILGGFGVRKGPLLIKI